VVDTGEKVSNFSISEGKVSLDDTKVVEEEMKRVLLDDVRESGIREGIISETMSEYKIRKRKEKQRAAREVKEVITRRANINDMYMMERFGIKGKGGLCYPNFMAVNFSGFMVGRFIFLRTGKRLEIILFKIMMMRCGATTKQIIILSMNGASC
jgi:hypothetical protein